jgi:NADPH2:quinone reductase
MALRRVWVSAVQIAKHLVRSERGLRPPRNGFVKSIGADHVIDYAVEDFTQNGETYDLIFDILGKSSFARCKNALKPNGILLFASFKMKQLVQMLRTTRSGSGKRVICSIAPGSLEDLNSVKELMEAGKIQAFIDRCYPMEQAAEAHHYVKRAQKRKLVITLQAKSNLTPNTKCPYLHTVVGILSLYISERHRLDLPGCTFFRRESILTRLEIRS